MKALDTILLPPLVETATHVVMGKNQPEYIPLPCDVLAGERHNVCVTRWELTDEERKLIAEGANIVHQVLTNTGFPPMNLQIVAEGENPEIVRG